MVGQLPSLILPMNDLGETVRERLPNPAVPESLAGW
jgi:hypothetical protein